MINDIRAQISILGWIYFILNPALRE
jgi:hypothetical protein